MNIINKRRKGFYFMNHYKVTLERTADMEVQPIILQQNERVQCIETSDPSGDWPNWVLCQSYQSNLQGWVPLQLLKIDSSNHTAITLEAYNALELNLEIGDLLIEAYALNGWIWCHKSNEPDYKGWAPLNHLMPL